MKSFVTELMRSRLRLAPNMKLSDELFAETIEDITELNGRLLCSQNFSAMLDAYLNFDSLRTFDQVKQELRDQFAYNFVLPVSTRDVHDSVRTFNELVSMMRTHHEVEPFSRWCMVALEDHRKSGPERITEGYPKLSKRTIEALELKPKSLADYGFVVAFESERDLMRAKFML